MARQENVNTVVDHDLRNALIRANIALLQREIREKNDWYTTRRVVVRKRNGRIHLSRLGSRQEQASNGYGSDFTLIDEPIPGRSSSSSFSSTFSS
ncbi:hypothetical protein GGS26DRAFT_595197 [Hypomontagnella submonticulosa]|nr:hypothetical protein GGS26DRAFT_595197 [Hypomontagnella submonticulosa]